MSARVGQTLNYVIQIMVTKNYGDTTYMSKIVFILTLLYSPSLLAATLTANNVPYVCQGGSNPQLCNSTVTTNNNNVGIGTSSPLGNFDTKVG